MISFHEVFSRDKGEGHLRLWWARASLGAPPGGPGHPEKLQGSWGQRPHLSSPSTGFLLCHSGRAAPPEPPNLPMAPASMRPQPGTSLAFLPQEHAWLWGAQLSRRLLSWRSVHEGLGQGWPWATRPDCSLSLCIHSI